jgi:hypothetical protein
MQPDAAVRADQTLAAVEPEDLHTYIFPDGRCPASENAQKTN